MSRTQLRAVDGHAPRPGAAFSLLELVISLAILSIGILGAMRVFPMGLRASQRSEMNSRATIVAKESMESLKLKSWNELTGETETTDGGFTITTKVREPAPKGLVDPTRLKAVEITVQWTQDGRSRQQRFITYVRRPSS